MLQLQATWNNKKAFKCLLKEADEITGLLQYFCTFACKVLSVCQVIKSFLLGGFILATLYVRYISLSDYRSTGLPDFSIVFLIKALTSVD